MKQTILTIIVAVLSSLVSVGYLTRPQSDFIEKVATQVLSGSVVETPATGLVETGTILEVQVSGTVQTGTEMTEVYTGVE